ncbi:MAG: hypothetical protein KBA61_19265, partial [Spirochaetes bacterium]|nr:hypothetical protein [Spirochaetota bacterium]
MKVPAFFIFHIRTEKATTEAQRHRGRKRIKKTLLPFSWHSRKGGHPVCHSFIVHFSVPSVPLWLIYDFVRQVPEVTPRKT